MSTANSIRVFSVDDHPLLREGIAALIKSQMWPYLSGRLRENYSLPNSVPLGRLRVAQGVSPG